MDGLQITIKMPKTEKWAGMLDELQDVFAEEMVRVTRAAGSIALGVVQEGTPRASGATTSLWKLVELGRASHRGRFMGFTVVLDHPFNYPGARHPGTGKVVNRGEQSLLTDLEYGTAPHDIPVPSGILSFIDRRTGGRIFRNMSRLKVVKHPGTKAYGFMRRAAAITQRAFEAMGEEVTARIVAKMNARQP